jgi:hypothetical protein
VRLGRKQEIFSRCLAQLLVFAHSRGYEVRVGEVERSREEAERKGFADSNHTRRLAADLHLFRSGAYLAETDDHLELGAFWESLSGEWDGELVECCWGGHFSDGNHYSVEHQGVK